MAIAIGVLAPAAPADADRITALTSSPTRLLSVSPASPDTVLSDVAITGLAGSVPLGIDVRPADGKLYLLTHDAGVGKLWTIDAATGAATFIATLAADPADATSPYTSLDSSQGVGIDFNPVPDRLRVVTGTNQNFRVNPANGLVNTDADLNPGSPVVTSVGYTNSVAGASATTLYDYGYSLDTLYIQNPPNNGTLVAVGSSGITTTDLTIGLDIAYPGNTAYLSARVATVYGLYTLNLSTGAATLVGQLAGGSTTIVDSAVTPDPPASPSSPPAAGPAPPQPDTTAPKIAVASLKLTRKGVVTTRLACPTGETRCNFSYTLRSAKAVRTSRAKVIKLGSGKASAVGGKRATVKIKLSKKNRALIRHKRKLAVKLRVVTVDAAGNKATATKRATLRAPR